MIAGGAMGMQAIRDDNADPNNWNPYDSSDIVIGDTPLGNAGAILFWVGTASALTSIHFFIRSNKKRKAAGAILYADKGVSFSPGIIMPGRSRPTVQDRTSSTFDAQSQALLASRTQVPLSPDPYPSTCVGLTADARFSVTIGPGSHLFPSRTQ